MSIWTDRHGVTHAVVGDHNRSAPAAQDADVRAWYRAESLRAILDDPDLADATEVTIETPRGTVRIDVTPLRAAPTSGTLTTDTPRG